MILRRNALPTLAWALLLAGGLAGCGGGGDAGPSINNDLFASVARVSAPGATYFEPTSSVPDATDAFIYFTASGPSGRGVFKVPAAGGAASAVFVGAPLVQPTDLALSADNQTLYIADPQAGRLFALPVGGGVPTEVAGTAGTAPVALDVRGGRIVFCGVDGGQSAIFEITASGATVRTKGAPLVRPEGIVAAADGTLFVADRGDIPSQGKVFRLLGATLTELAGGLSLGTPPGIALTPDENTIAVSSRSAGDGTAQVVTIDRASGLRRLFNKTIGANGAPGGLHGARNAAGALGVYSWVDQTAGIYRLRG